MTDEGLRERKKRETRKKISDVATALFVAHGFENVTVADVARAADVSKMTVFNYFPRKEDLFFDREHEGRELVHDALAQRRKRSPLAALRALVDALIAEKHPFAKWDPGVSQFWKTVEDSPALLARIRELRDELERDLAQSLAASVDASPTDPVARLVAAILLDGWRLAYAEALQRQRAGVRAQVARDAFVALIDRAFAAATAAARSTPYA